MYVASLIAAYYAMLSLYPWKTSSFLNGNEGGGEKGEERWGEGRDRLEWREGKHQLGCFI